MCHCAEYLFFHKFFTFSCLFILLFIVKINLNDMYILNLTLDLQNWNTYLIQIFTYGNLCLARILVNLDTWVFFFILNCCFKEISIIDFLQKAQLFFCLFVVEDPTGVTNLCPVRYNNIKESWG